MVSRLNVCMLITRAKEVNDSISAQGRISALKRGELASSCSLSAPFIQQNHSCQPHVAFLVWSVSGSVISTHSFSFSIIQSCPQRIKGLQIMTQIRERVLNIETDRLIDIESLRLKVAKSKRERERERERVKWKWLSCWSERLKWCVWWETWEMIWWHSQNFLWVNQDLKFFGKCIFSPLHIQAGNALSQMSNWYVCVANYVSWSLAGTEIILLCVY